MRGHKNPSKTRQRRRPRGDDEPMALISPSLPAVSDKDLSPSPPPPPLPPHTRSKPEKNNLKNRRTDPASIKISPTPPPQGRKSRNVKNKKRSSQRKRGIRSSGGPDLTYRGESRRRAGRRRTWGWGRRNPAHLKAAAGPVLLPAAAAPPPPLRRLCRRRPATGGVEWSRVEREPDLRGGRSEEGGGQKGDGRASAGRLKAETIVN